VKTNLLILVGLDLSALGRRINTPGTIKRDNGGGHAHRYSLDGIVGNDGY
jgi:hypothetical protein